MPSYFYHLKLELYPTPHPAVDDSNTEADIWLPPTDADIFADLPSHPRPKQQTLNPLVVRPEDHTDNPLSRNTAHQAPAGSVIDCGARPSTQTSKEKKTEGIPELSPTAAIHPSTATRDWRFGRVSIETTDFSTRRSIMTDEPSPSSASTLGPVSGGVATRAELLPLRTSNTEVGWGVVHFYRDGDETPSLATSAPREEEDEDADCNTLCIPAVPSYLTPSDVLGFVVGDKWQHDISQCRMVMTAQTNLFLVLFRFWNSKRAREWRDEFNGKLFNTVRVSQRKTSVACLLTSFQSEICHVVFVKSVTFETPLQSPIAEASAPSTSGAVAGTSKPFAPPTANLVELPTCPVCLERMDETSGLMTIQCSHVFHCTCLQSWRGFGCPVCRFTNPSETKDGDPINPYAQPFGSSASNLCSVCDCAEDLWICLICGYIGCGRYKGAHAKEHWKDTAHSFALELETQHVWDYAGDMWVHRLLRDKGDGKLVELPARGHGIRNNEDGDVVPRAKLESIGLEYAHLIMSQLESQRAYYEEILSKAVDKASKASIAAEEAVTQASKAVEKVRGLEEKQVILLEQTIPQLEKDLAREKAKGTKSEALARSLGKALQEEKKVNEGLMKRIEHLGKEAEDARETMSGLKEETVELKEMNRDLSMFISGQEKLKEMEKEGQLEEGELAEGAASVPESKSKARRRGRK